MEGRLASKFRVVTILVLMGVLAAAGLSYFDPGVEVWLLRGGVAICAALGVYALLSKSQEILSLRKQMMEERRRYLAVLPSHIKALENLSFEELQEWHRRIEHVQCEARAAISSMLMRLGEINHQIESANILSKLWLANIVQQGGPGKVNFASRHYKEVLANVIRDLRIVTDTKDSLSVLVGRLEKFREELRHMAAMTATIAVQKSRMNIDNEGRGFSEVASEVRRLVNISECSIQDICSAMDQVVPKISETLHHAKDYARLNSAAANKDEALADEAISYFKSALSGLSAVSRGAFQGNEGLNRSPSINQERSTNNAVVEPTRRDGGACARRSLENL